MLHRVLLVFTLVLGFPDALALQEDGADLPPSAQGIDQDDVAQDEVLELLAWQLEQGDHESAQAILTEVLEPGARTLVADREDQDALDFLKALDRIAESLGDLNAQFELRTEVLRRREESLDSGDAKLLGAKHNLAKTQFQLGDLEGALALQEQVHATCERLFGPEHQYLRKAKSNLAVARAAMGDIEGALTLMEEVHAALQGLALDPEDPALLGVEQTMGGLQSSLGDIEGALVLHERVYAVRKRLLPADDPDLLRTTVVLAMTRRQLGDLEVALALLEHAHSAYERLFPPDHPSLLDAKTALAAVRAELGDLEGAHSLFDDVHASRERILLPDSPDLLQAKVGLAVTRRELGDREGALALLEHVHAAREPLFAPDHPGLLNAKLHLAATRRELGDFEGALALMEHVHAAQVQVLPPDHPYLLLTKRDLAMTRARLGDLEDALALLEYVNAAFERVRPPAHPDRLAVVQSLATTRRSLGDIEGACELSRVLADGTSTFVLRGLATPPREARAITRDAGQRLAQGRIWDSAREAPEAILKSYVRASETIRHVTTARTGVGAGTDSEVDARTELRRAAASARRALDNHIARVPDLPERAQDQPEDEWKRALGASQSEWNRKLEQLSLDRDAREKELLAALGGSRSMVTYVSAEEISAALEEDAVAVGFHRVDCWTWGTEGKERTYAGEHYVAFVIAADGSVAEIDLGSATEIDEMIERWRDAVGAPVLRGVGSKTDLASEIDVGSRLRARVFDPLSEACGLGQCRRIYMCVDDALHTVPLDALPLTPTAQLEDDATTLKDALRLGDIYEIRTELSFARLLEHESKADEPPSLLTVGGVDFEGDLEDRGELAVQLDARTVARAQAGAGRNSRWGSWGSLNATRSEVEAIADFAELELGVEAVHIGGSDLTAATLEQGVRGKRFVHIATHGWFMPETVQSMLNGDPSDESTDLLGTEWTVSGFAPMALCGLVMSGANAAETPGELAARLLTAMELSTFDLWDCELAVLSACETNVGVARAGQGIQSLQTALHQAGARASVTSLWRVDDYATRDLMRAFYSNLWEKGMGKAEALWDAKCQLRRRGEPVRHWAGWVLVGDPD
ncbi:MAG: CHAT domain-containing tetratricopeptide repeat protein [Planctomycetota bacterium]